MVTYNLDQSVETRISIYRAKARFNAYIKGRLMTKYTRGASVWNHAAEFNDIEVLEALHDMREICNSHPIDYAAKEGHMDAAKWLYDNVSSNCTTNAMDWSAKNGHLEVLKWLHENCNGGCTTDAMDRAAENGHLEVLMWLHENRQEGCTTNAMDWAARNNHLDILKWLCDHCNLKLEKCVLIRAMNDQHFALIDWFYENKKEFFDEECLDHAEFLGDEEVISYIENYTN